MGAGSFTFGNRKAVVYNSIESVNPTGATVDLTLDLSFFTAGAANLITAGLDGTGTNFVVTVSNNGANPMTVDNEAQAAINSFTVKGTSSPETLDLVESAAGLPSFPGAATGNGAHSDASMLPAGDLPSGGPAINFAGNGGSDTFQVDLLQSHTVSYFSDNDATGSGNVAVDGLLVSIESVHGVTVNGNAGSDALTVLGAATASVFGITPTQVTVNGSETATSAGVARVTVNGGNGSDTFSVTPSATTTFNVNGGLPNLPASPGDTLNVNLTGVTNPILIKTFSRPTGYSGSWVFANRQDVNFTGIESLLPPEASTAVLKTNGELDLFNSLSGQLQVLSRAGTILSVSAVQAGDAATDVFAITSGLVGAQFQNTLWEFSTVTGWSQLSTGSFAQISAATNSAGQGVVFGVLTDGSLYEQDPAVGTGLNAGFTRLSPSGTIASVSAVTDLSGNPTVYAVVTGSGNVWEHSPALPGNGWTQLSTGSFQQVSAGLNGAGQAVVYSVVKGGSLWEQNPAVGIGLNAGWTQLSGTAGAPAAFLSAAAGRPNEVFGIAADHTLWEHTAAGFQQISTGSFARISPSETAAQDLAFAALTDGEFWEYDAGLPPGNPWTQVMANGQPVTGVASSSTT